MIVIGELGVLGDLLKTRRQSKKMSLAGVAQPARISPAYLQKLELGSVKNPSPRVLHRVAGVLGLSYARLMMLAGYAMPTQEDINTVSLYAHSKLATSLEDLSPEEQQAVAAFIQYLKAQRSKD